MEQKKIMDDNYKASLQNEEVKMRIEHSKKQNEMRISRMRKVNEYVEELRKQTKTQLRQKLKSDQKTYKALLEDLLVQGLIKMMEPKLFIRCRAADVSLIKEVEPTAIKKYRDMLVKEVKKFQGFKPADIPCEIIIDKVNLDSVEDNETTGILGGFKMYAKKGRIVCS